MIIWRGIVIYSYHPVRKKSEFLQSINCRSMMVSDACGRYPSEPRGLTCVIIRYPVFRIC